MSCAENEDDETEEEIYEYIYNIDFDDDEEIYFHNKSIVRNSLIGYIAKKVHESIEVLTGECKSINFGYVNLILYIWDLVYSDEASLLDILYFFGHLTCTSRSSIGISPTQYYDYPCSCEFKSLNFVNHNDLIDIITSQISLKWECKKTQTHTGNYVIEDSKDFNETFKKMIYEQSPRNLFFIIQNEKLRKKVSSNIIEITFERIIIHDVNCDDDCCEDLYEEVYKCQKCELEGNYKNIQEHMKSHPNAVFYITFERSKIPVFDHYENLKINNITMEEMSTYETYLV